MVRDRTSLENYHSVYCNSADISGGEEVLETRAEEQEWAHGSEAYAVDTGVRYLWDASAKNWVAQNAPIQGGE